MDIKIESVVVRGDYYEVGFKVNDSFTVFSNVYIKPEQTEAMVIEKAWISAKKEAESRAGKQPITFKTVKKQYVPPKPKPCDLIITPFNEAAYIVDQYGDIMDIQPEAVITEDKISARYGELTAEVLTLKGVVTDGISVKKTI